jgi:serine/threonine kinase 38
LYDYRDNKISLVTFNRVKIAKEYIEKKYKLKKLKEEESRKEWGLIYEKMKNLNLNQSQELQIRNEILKKEAESIRAKRQKNSVFDYTPLSIIGKGAFGEVRVCKHKKSNEVVAIKKLRKEEMHRKNQIIHVRTEKEMLAKADQKWVVGLKASFQDENYLYLVMDYLPGGDLMSQLIKKDIFTENEGKFYMAELVLAVESIHNLNCIHRDLKPDNILIDAYGHIKLSDFGLSKMMENDMYAIPSFNDINNNQDRKSNSGSNTPIASNIINRIKKQRRMVRSYLSN